MGVTAEEINKVKERIGEWIEYSSENHPYEQVREKAILDSMINYKSSCSAEQLEKISGRNSSILCYAYLSKNQIFTEEQIEEMAVITSPLFPLMNFSTSDKDNMKTSIRILQAGPDSDVQKKEIKQILQESEGRKDLSKSYQYFLFQLEDMIKKSSGIPKQGITDRFDWRDLVKYQNLSPEFCKRWRNNIKSQITNPNGYTKSYHSSSVVKSRASRARKRNNR